ncbi:MAG: hypothetical protein JNL66_19745 [Alphaproteobacteria bacterium]|nr:hypothetical protein [Alphaproteobacteria bacterium]
MRTPRPRRVAVRHAAALALVAALAFADAPAAAQRMRELPEDTPASCRAPAATIGDPVPLVRAAAEFRRSRRLKIVAIGSSSTAGGAASEPARAWPAQLEAALRRRLPNAEISVANMGAVRQTSAMMVARFARVVAERPDIVVWEVGTAEAVRHLDVDDFLRVVVNGIEQLAAAGIEVILVDPQYTRDTARLITFEPYLAAIARAAQMRDAAHFRRFQVMRYWVDNDQFQFDGARPAEFSRIADAAYECVGRLLAHFVIAGLRIRP